MPNDGDTMVWEFTAVIDAAVFSVLYRDQDVDDFADRVWEAYTVIERRITESDTDALITESIYNKEQAVKEIAKKFEDGFDDTGRLARAKVYYETVSNGGPGKDSTTTPPQRTRRFDPYSR